MKKLILILLITGVVFSCNDRLEDINTPRKRAQEVPAEPLFANGVREMFDLMTNTNVNINVFRLYAQYWAQTTYPDESQYNMVNRFIPDNFWTNAYRDVLMDLETAKQRVEETAGEINLPEEQKINQIAIIDITQVYMYSILVDAFGAVPYSEALNPEILTPKYDAGSEVYASLIDRLNGAIAALNVDADGFSSTQDLIFGGDVSGWLKFANSIKVRLATNISDVDPGKASTMIAEAIASGVLGPGEKAAIQYKESPPNTNPLWEDLVQSGRRDYVTANTLMDKLARFKDPRLPIYATGRVVNFEDADGNLVDVKITAGDSVILYYPNDGTIMKVATPYTLDAETHAESGVMTFRGAIYGSANAYASFNPVGQVFYDPALEGVLIDYSQVQFWLAEVAAKGIATDATAEEHYNNGISASLEYWGVDDAAIDAYLSTPEVAYNPVNWKQLVGVQEWLSEVNKPFEGWTTWRRLDFEGFNVPAGLEESDIPRRFIFPVEEATLNPTASKTAADMIGGDNVQSKVFWDVQ